MNGACGAGAFVFTGVNAVGREFGVCRGGALERLYEGDELPSLLLREHAPRRHAIVHRPVVMNQKTSPSGTVCVGPSERGGMLPVPCPLAP